MPHLPSVPVYRVRRPQTTPSTHVPVPNPNGPTRGGHTGTGVGRRVYVDEDRVSTRPSPAPRVRSVGLGGEDTYGSHTDPTHYPWISSETSLSPTRKEGASSGTGPDREVTVDQTQEGVTPKQPVTQLDRLV